MNKAVNNKSKILYQLQKLRKLSQPFFLPIDQCNGFQFIWLLISLLFCVGGIVLVGLQPWVGAGEGTNRPQPHCAMNERHFQTLLRKSCLQNDIEELMNIESI